MESAKCPSKRKSFTVEQKVQFIKMIDNGEQQISVSNKFGVKPNTLSDIYKHRERIIEEWNRGCTAKKHFKSADNDALDNALPAWFKKQRADNVPLSQVLLIEKAKEVAEQIGDANFRGSSGYIDRFEKRHDPHLSELIHEVEEKLAHLHTSSKVQSDIRSFLVASMRQPTTERTVQPEGVGDNATESQVCCVCGSGCDGAHWCLVCHLPVHAICGEHDSEAEGFGQPMTVPQVYCIDVTCIRAIFGFILVV